ncbi:bifunctional proline dehydrogenase/L-glutamate gamma-semialdehyde dehydrogenase [bacterium]|nr:bifunctional proline dehydrogenase/L-glutamate gamma-semialdehyde dehydrogenase [bacterium]
MSELEIKEIIEKAAELAEFWQQRADQLIEKKEKIFQKQMASLLRHPIDKVVLTKMIDQAFRSSNNRRIADQIIFTLKKNKVPEFFTSWEKALVGIFLRFGQSFADLSVPQVVKKMRDFSKQAILPGESAPLFSHLKKRKNQGVRMNVNHLGEAVLGEEESKVRLETYIKDLQKPEIEYISVKISTIYSQIQPLAFRHTVAVLKDRLSMLYRTAMNNTFVRRNGEKVPKFINLDMEEYRDLEITTAAFIETLDQEEFKFHKAGIVLQAYLPDSHGIQKQLTEWAISRVKAGGSPIKIRIVKGANMEMEMVDSEINNWPLATYDVKTDVDANYKKMVLYGMRPEHAKVVNLGIASHNLFELAFAYQVGQHYNVLPHIDFEMLEGMADHIRRAITENTGDVLLYAPVAGKDQFINAIAYLIRRLDENTAPDNFLRYAPGLKLGSKEWEFLKNQFYESCEKINRISESPNRTQNRLQESFPEKMGTFFENEFVNEPDTDWSSTVNRKWSEQIREKWMRKPGDNPIEIPIIVGGKEVFDNRDVKESFDPSQIQNKVVVSRFRLGNEEDVLKAVTTAKDDTDGWRSLSHEQRHGILSKVAMELRKGRGDLIGTAAANTGKLFTEADVEVSEAIDFAEYYPYTVKQFLDIKTVKGRGKGVGVVISPWNFPIAIPCGGIVASLAAGNTVIFKPASDSVLVAWELCKCFWKAGVPKTVLQFLPCPGSKVGTRLVEHPDIDFVILTGGTDTGMKMLEQKPGLLLAAETGGKNATIVTAMSDRDQAIKNVVYSAFGNAGQKCSATSLLILEKEVYEDENFKRQLIDTARSFSTGGAWQFQNKMGPLIKPPESDLKTALTSLEPGESWALKPEIVDGNPYIWSPGIKWDVSPGSFTHMTEFFGPVLAVMCAENLEQAIELTNQTGYGLTSGIESLDPREIEIWKKGIEAGNLYINRGTTGAITLRQPFGGMKKSALGAGIKAGSPNYTAQFMSFGDLSVPITGTLKEENRMIRLLAEWKIKTRWNKFSGSNPEIEKTVRALKSYLFHFENEFSKENDYFNLRGQDNILRYLPLGTIVVRVHETDSLFECLARIVATLVTKNKIIVSIPTGFDNEVLRFLRGREGARLLQGQKLVFESDEDLIKRMPAVARIRYADFDRVPQAVFEAAAKIGFYISCTPVLMEGRIELLQYLLNQSICHTYHRYGNLGERNLKIS